MPGRASSADSARSDRRCAVTPHNVPLTPPSNLRLLALSVATSIDALAVGLSLAVLRIPVLRPVLVIGIVTLAISYLGIVLGHELQNLLRGRLKRDIQVVGGLVLIAIGLRILISHLAR